MSRKQEVKIQNEIIEFIGGETDDASIDALSLQYASKKEKEGKHGSKK